MKAIQTPLEGLILFELDVFRDNRGFFVERFHFEKFKGFGLELNPFQLNHSRSQPGSLRGIHYQHTPAQGKLVGVTRGRIWDVAVDLRHNSPTFGQHYAVELSDQNGLLLWVPAGFGHGLCVMGDEDADVLYAVDCSYSKAGEGGIAWDDSSLGIQWPVSNPEISERDRHLQSLSEYKNNPVF